MGGAARRVCGERVIVLIQRGCVHGAILCFLDLFRLGGRLGSERVGSVTERRWWSAPVRWPMGLVGLTPMLLAAQVVAQAPSHGSGPTLTVGVAAAEIQSTCPSCGTNWSRGNRTLTASLAWSLPGVHGALAARGLLFGTTGRQLSAITLTFEAMPLKRWLRIGAGLGAGGYRDSVLAVIPLDPTPRPQYVTALAPMMEFHIAAAVPVARHVEFGPVVGYVTSIGGFSTFSNSHDRAVVYAGVQLGLH